MITGLSRLIASPSPKYARACARAGSADGSSDSVMPPSGRLQARHKLLAPSHARNIAPPIRIAASEPGQTATNTDNPRPHAMAIVALAAAAPLAVTNPARLPPSSVV